MSSESEAIVAAITAMASTLSSRIESTETDFVGHLKKVEDRLDILVDLTKTVAVLQHQSAQFNEHINQVREQIREGQVKTDSSISRLHVRIDELNTSLRDRVELAKREMDIDLKGIKQDHSALKDTVNSWVNWGKGAYAIGAVLCTFAVWTGSRWLDDLEKSRTILTTDVVGLKRDLTAVDSRNFEINSKLNDHIHAGK